MKVPQSSARMPMRFKHLAVLSLVLWVAACGQGGGADKGGKAHGGPGGGMPAAEVNVATVQPQKGQSLFTIDPAPFEAALARAQADVAAAEARVDQAKRNAARLKPLYAE